MNEENRNDATTPRSVDQQQACSAWQPIATAPRDGTDIIVGYDFASVWIVHAAFWNDEDCYGDKLPANDEKIGWWSYIEHSVTQTLLTGDNSPTHWMPLPMLPNAPAMPTASEGRQLT